MLAADSDRQEDSNEPTSVLGSSDVIAKPDVSSLNLSSLGDAVDENLPARSAIEEDLFLKEALSVDYLRTRLIKKLFVPSSEAGSWASLPATN